MPKCATWYCYTHMELSACIQIPPSSIEHLQTALQLYGDSNITRTPKASWNIALLSFGEKELSSEQLQELQQPITLSFHPVITILSIGKSQIAHELRASIQPNTILDTIRSTIISRAQQVGILLSQAELHREFTPHVVLGTAPAEQSIADMPARTSFSVHQLAILSEAYAELGTIPVTP